MDCTVQLERLDPAMLIQPQTQNKEVSKTKKSRKYTKEVSKNKKIQKYTKEEMREKHRKQNGVYRKKKIDGFNLLNKCVPGTKKLFHLDILMSAVNYIKELENKIKKLEKESPMEFTPLTPTGMERDSVPKITLHHYNSKSTE
jgi:outer membrane biosynthesis protein TonB